MSLQALWGRRLFRCWASLLVMIGKRFANQPGQLVPARVGYVGQHGVAARAAAGQLWTLSSWPAMDSEASTTEQLSFYAAAAVPPSPVCSTQSQTPRLQLDQFFSQGFVFAPKIALFAQNLCFPMLPCLQMFCLFCINLQLEGFAGNLKEARSFYLWLSSSTLQAG